MNATWYVIGNRAGARIFERDGDALNLVLELNHEVGRLKSGEIDTDRSGFSFKRGGSSRHPMNPEESSHDHTARNFAREIAQALRAARNAHRYSGLVMIAEPKFLGMMKEALDHATAALVQATVGKDLANVSIHAMPDHLREFV